MNDNPTGVIEQELSALKISQLGSNTAVLANIFELVSKVISNIANSDISESLGKNLNKSVLMNLIANNIQEKLK